jgi:23S rRNA pseudouridine1911/1915/1917 synthase
MQLSVTPSERVTFGILHQDAHLLVVHKRAGLVTQPGKGHDDDSLLSGLFARFGKQLQALGARRDYGLLHRLDRETSGLLVVGLSAHAYDHLREQFEARTVRKFYWAVAAKAPAPPRPPTGLVNKPIAESEPKKLGEKKLARISGSGKPAVTAYRVLATNPDPAGGGVGALLECRPLTGRLHQVRVHLEAIGCPILGDGLYAPPKVAALAPRLCLHAHRLAFAHPVTGATIDCHSEFPKDLRSVLKRFGLPVPDASAGPAAPSAPAADDTGADA